MKKVTSSDLAMGLINYCHFAKGDGWKNTVTIL